MRNLHNVSQSLPNSEFVSILVKTWNFSPIQHFHSCFLVFYHVSINEKQNWECILPSHLFAFLNNVGAFQQLVGPNFTQFDTVLKYRIRINSVLIDAFCQSSFRWIYCYGSNKFTVKETGKSHLCVQCMIFLTKSTDLRNGSVK